MALNAPTVALPDAMSLQSGSGMSASWAAGPINSFAALWASVLSNGWKVSTAAMATAPLTFMSLNSPGQYYMPPLSDPLFDL